jgi:hypothetical protein
MSKRAEYHRKWYLKNKQKYNQSRQKQYATDPDLRKTILEKNRAYRDTRVAVVPTPTPDGVVGINKLAGMLHVPSTVVKNVENAIDLPGEPITDEWGKRAFTPEQALKIMSICKISKEKTFPTKPKIIGRILTESGNVFEEPIITITELSWLCARSVGSMKYMEKHGILPVTPLKVGNKKVYTESMAQNIKKLIRPLANRQIRLSRNGPKIYKAILENWKELQIINSKLI